MKKIAVIIPGFIPVPAVQGGGVETLITDIIEINDIKKDYLIDLFTVDDERLDCMKYSNTNIIQIKCNVLEKIVEKIINHFLNKFHISYHISFYIQKTTELVRRNKYDAVLIENNMYNYQYIVKRIPKNNYFFHLHNDIGKYDKPQFLCQYIMRTAKAVLTCSDFITHRFIELTDASNVFTLNNCIDHSFFCYDKNERKKIREKFRIKDEFVFGYIGRISEEKGVSELLDAYIKLREKEVCKLFIIGKTSSSEKSSFFARLENKASRYIDDIVFIDQIPNKELYKYLSAIECVVVPTICEEAFGMVAIEAMYCKRALIVTNSGGMKDIVKGSAAVVVSMNNIVDNLRKAMYEIMCSEGKAEILGNMNYSFIVDTNNYTIERYYLNFKDIMEKNI